MKPFKKVRESAKIAARRKETLQLLALERKATVFSERWLSQREGYGLEVSRVREFDLEDDPEETDFESLAAGERNVVIRQALEGAVFMIFADVSPSLTYYPNYPEYSKGFIRDIAVALLVNSAYQGMSPVGLITFSDKIEQVFHPQSGEYARYILDQFFAVEVEEERSTSLACIEPYLREFQDAIIFVISDFQDEELETSPFWNFGIEGLDLIPIVVRDPLEKVVLGGRASFCCSSPENGENFPVHITEKHWQEIRRASAHFYRSLFQRFSQREKGYIILDSADVDKCHQRLQRFFARRAEWALYNRLP
jgi:hypothetical protein